MQLQGGLLHLEIRFIKSAENNCIIIDSMISKKYIYVKYVKKYAILNKYYDFQKFEQNPKSGFELVISSSQIRQTRYFNHSFNGFMIIFNIFFVQRKQQNI